MTRPLVVLPTFNEKENLPRILPAIRQALPSADIVVVDDLSPDGTGDIADSFSQSDAKIHVLHRDGPRGLGRAYLHGFSWALARDYTHIFEMDADFSHDPNDLERLLSACTDQGGDMSIGSRYCKGGKIENWPFTRWMMSYFASFYVRTVLWMNIKDTTAGFKCYSRKVLEAIDLNEIRFVGYAFQIEMKYTAYKLGFKIVEVPITFKDRELGQSKMSMSIFKEAFLGVFKMRKR